MGIYDFVKRHPSATAATIGAMIGLGVGKLLSDFFSGQHQQVQQQQPTEEKIVPHSLGETVNGDGINIDGKIVENVTFGIPNGTLVYKTDNGTSEQPIAYSDQIEILNQMSKNSERHVLVPLGQNNGTIEITEPSLIKYFVENSSLGIDSNNVSAINIYGYVGVNGTLGVNGTFGFAVVKLTDGTELKVSLDKVLDWFDNLKVDGSWEKVEKAIRAGDKEFGSLEDVLKQVPDSYTSTFAKLKTWANEKFNIIYGGSSASELLDNISQKLSEIENSNLNTLKNTTTEYKNFVKGIVGSDNYSANFTKVDDIIKNMTFGNVNASLENITKELNWIVNDWIEKEKAVAVKNVRNSIYNLFWESIAQNISKHANISKDYLIQKFGFENSTAISELEKKYGLIATVLGDPDKQEYFNKTGVDVSDLYLNKTLSYVLDQVAKADKYSDVKASIADIDLQNMTGSLLNKSIDLLANYSVDYPWLVSYVTFDNRNISELQKMLNENGDVFSNQTVKLILKGLNNNITTYTINVSASDEPSYWMCSKEGDAMKITASEYRLITKYLRGEK